MDQIAGPTIRQFEPWVGEEEKEMLTKVIDSGWITEHKLTREFERKLADYLGARYAIATTSGTVAIFLAVAAAGIGAGHEVLVPTYTFVGTANAVRLAGARPVFVDMRPHDANMDPADAARKVTSATRAILPVHVNGRPADVDGLQELAHRHNLTLIEDASQTLGSCYRQRHLGTFGDLGCLSFATSKILTTAQGGMVVTDSEELFEKVFRLKDHGRTQRVGLREVEDHYDHLGYNFKFTDLQAAIGLAQFEKLGARVGRIRAMFKHYRECLQNARGIRFMDFDMREGTPWHVDMLLTSGELATLLHQALATRNIGTQRFFRPLHTQPLYGSAGSFPNAEQLAPRGLFLPSSYFMTDPEVDYVCVQIREALADQ